MIKKHLTKAIALALITTALIAFNPIWASAAWKEDSKGWWYTEGNSYAKGWRSIDGNWYYFNINGYMGKNTIVDGYYLDENGAWTKNMPKEVNAYINKLGNSSWINQYTNGAASKNLLLDINKDGVKEMLLFYERKGSGLAGMTASIVTYNNGNVKLKEIAHHGGFYGYLKEENVIFAVSGNQGYSTYDGYKIENGDSTEVYKCTDGIAAGKNNCSINGENVSKEKYNKFLNKIDTTIEPFSK